jgi:hypothetical protein
MPGWIAVLFLILLIIFSLALRMKHFRRTVEAPDSKASVLSIAVRDLVATAGGVYLSLVMLVSFLKMDIPEKVPLFECGFDPLALMALTLSIIQPLAIRIFYDKGK